MKVLIVKLSSLGDVVHTLPALHEAVRAKPEIEFHWVLERSLAGLLANNSAVSKIISVELRCWRKQPWRAWHSGQWQRFLKTLRAESYDLIIDAQGLIKSALIAALAKGPVLGLDFASAREPLASLFYQQKIAISKQLHAVQRLRQLFAQACDYVVPDRLPQVEKSAKRVAKQKTVLFLHGTTWPTKHWPLAHWQRLAQLAIKAGYQVAVTWGNEAEKNRTYRLQQAIPMLKVIEKQPMEKLATLLSRFSAVVAVDTGLAHLAASLGIPALSLYGPTEADHTGTYGVGQFHLSSSLSCAPCKQERCRLKPISDYNSPCMQELSVEIAWQQLQNLTVQEQQPCG